MAGDSQDDAPRAGEVYFELLRAPNALRLVAIDAATGTEVTVMGPVNASRDDLERIALRKLQRRIEAQQKTPRPPGDGKLA